MPENKTLTAVVIGSGWAGEGHTCALRLAHLPLGSELTPWSWFDSLASGGGALNAGMTHFLGMLERLTGSEVVGASGEARVLRRRAPVGICAYCR